MADPEFIPLVSHESDAYRDLFHHFLRHTDQKFRAKRWLNQLVDKLPKRRLFVDVGAGDGTLTNDLVNRFDRTIALEPNPRFCAELRKTPGLDVREENLDDAQGITAVDLVLCSHVFYLIPQARWLESVRRLTSWLSPTGALVVSGQSRHTDCKNLVEHFYGERRDLGKLMELQPELDAAGLAITVSHVESHIDTPDLPAACKVAEFVLNVSGQTQGPKRADVEMFVRRNYVQPSGYFKISCHQDFYLVRPKGLALE